MKRWTIPLVITGLLISHFLAVPLVRLLPQHGQVWLGVAAGIVFFALPFWLLYRHSKGKLSDPADNDGWWDHR